MVQKFMERGRPQNWIVPGHLLGAIYEVRTRTVTKSNATAEGGTEPPPYVSDHLKAVIFSGGKV